VAKERDIKTELLRTKGEFTSESMARDLEVGSQAIKQALDELLEAGYKFVDNGGVYLRTKSSCPSNFDASRMFKNGELHFGLVSDTHFGSNRERLDALEMAYDRFANEGINVVFHCGDWTEGVGVYRGQEMDVNLYGQDAQIDHVIKDYPSRRGMKTIGISGNHDLRAYERGGVDPLVQIARARRDITYIGQYNTDVRLHRGVNMELIHPMGNPAYALSYKAQRDINNRSPDDLPNVLCYGHYHNSYYMHYRGIDFVQVPCFKGAGYFEKRLGLNPTIGAWIIDGKSDGNTIQNFKPDLFTFGERR